MIPGELNDEAKNFLVSQLQRVINITLKDFEKGITIEKMMLSLIEEVGELATAIKIVNGQKNKNLDEPPLTEAVDVIICGLAMYSLCEGKFESLSSYLKQKLNKWENFQQEKLRGGVE